ncbi:MAG TPA: hypothetical protein VNA16_01025, partial [Abditibacteriaceae bacterium]|nr:hypothetical protein [Abditibacteriaceae bacterium]
MEQRTLRLLELDKILARLEEAAASELGRSRVRAIKPLGKPDEVRRRLAETSEARRFGEAGKTPPFGGVRDIGAYLQSAAIGSVLEAAELLAVAHLAAGARRLRETITARLQNEFPILH